VNVEERITERVPEVWRKSQKTFPPISVVYRSSITEIEESIQSAISYAGGNPNTIDCFCTVEYVLND
jgi:hypothetical protein